MHLIYFAALIWMGLVIKLKQIGQSTYMFDSKVRNKNYQRIYSGLYRWSYFSYFFLLFSSLSYYSYFSCEIPTFSYFSYFFLGQWKKIEIWYLLENWNLKICVFIWLTIIICDTSWTTKTVLSLICFNHERHLIIIIFYLTVLHPLFQSLFVELSQLPALQERFKW